MAIMRDPDLNNDFLHCKVYMSIFISSKWRYLVFQPDCRSRTLQFDILPAHQVLPPECRHILFKKHLDGMIWTHFFLEKKQVPSPPVMNFPGQIKGLVFSFVLWHSQLWIHSCRNFQCEKIQTPSSKFMQRLWVQEEIQIQIEVNVMTFPTVISCKDFYVVNLERNSK